MTSHTSIPSQVGLPFYFGSAWILKADWKLELRLRGTTLDTSPPDSLPSQHIVSAVLLRHGPVMGNGTTSVGGLEERVADEF